jgi:hypothetical protein
VKSDAEARTQPVALFREKTRDANAAVPYLRVSQIKYIQDGEITTTDKRIRDTASSYQPCNHTQSYIVVLSLLRSIQCLLFANGFVGKLKAKGM